MKKDNTEGGVAQKGDWARIFCRFKGRLGKKKGGGPFEGDLIPQCTLCIVSSGITYFNWLSYCYK